MGRRGRGAGAGGRTSHIVLEFKQPETSSPRTASSSKTSTSSSSRPSSSGSGSSKPTNIAENLLASDDNETLLEKLVQHACDQESLVAVIEEMTNCNEKRVALNSSNSNTSYEEFELLQKSKKLDSTLKKCNGFVRRLRNYTSSQKQAVESEVETLNLSKYLSEICAAVVETRLKVSDMADIVSICSIIHVRYQEFSELMLEAFKTSMTLKKTELTPSALSKFSLDLRLLTELVLTGVLGQDALGIIIAAIRAIVSNDKDAQFLIPILVISKAFGYELAGIVPTHLKQLCDTFQMELPACNLIPSTKQIKIKTMLIEYIQSVAGVWVNLHEDTLNSELSCRRMLKNKGEITKDREDAHAEILAKFEKFNTHVTRLACYLDYRLPELRVLVPDPEEEALEDLLGLDGAAEGGGEISSFFDDEETRSFYQDLPDLTKYLTSAAKRENALHLEKEAEKLAAAEADIDEEKEMAELQAERPATAEEEETTPETDLETVANHEKAQQDLEKQEEPVAPTLVTYLSSLSNCVNRNMIDEAAELFLNKFNNKPNRRKLASAICHLPRQRLDLIPIWSRLIAVLRPITPDVTDEVVSFLRKEFNFLVRKKHQTFIESKLKVTRFIAELVNFAVFPPSEAFKCFKHLLMDFAHHQIEMACVFVEVCGRYLHKNPATRRRMKIYLDEMMRKKQAKALEPRYVHMVDHSYFYVHPPEGAAKRTKPPVEAAYINDLLCNSMSRETLEDTILFIRALSWDEKTTGYVTKTLSQPWRMTYPMLALNASLLAGIKHFQREVVIHVLDSVLEDVRAGIETPDPRYNQRMITLVTYLGELFCYEITSSKVIFDVLYAIISIGVTNNYNIRSYSDPPDSGFRIRLACTLLRTVGDYFFSGNPFVSTKLKYFLKYLQRYFYYKKEDPIWAQTNRAFPHGTTMMFEDIILNLDEDMRLYGNYKKASAKIAKMERSLKEKLEKEMKSKGVDLAEAFLPNIPEGLEEEDEPGTPTRYLGNRRPFRNFPEGPSQRNSKKNTYAMDDSSQSYNQSGPQAPQNNHPDESDSFLELGLEEPRLLDPKEVPNVPRRIGTQSQAEIDEFDRELEKLMNEASHAPHARDPRHVGAEIRIPMNIHKKPHVPSAEPGMVNFSLLVKKGNKPSVKHIEMPENDEIVQRMRRREAAEIEERAQLKKLTLGINRLQMDEEMMEDKKF